MTPLEPGHWVGWCRQPGGAWERVCTAPTLEECSRQLGRLKPQARNVDLFLTTSAYPREGVPP
jgi:hypothetical protein